MPVAQAVSKDYPQLLDLWWLSVHLRNEELLSASRKFLEHRSWKEPMRIILDPPPPRKFWIPAGVTENSLVMESRGRIKMKINIPVSRVSLSCS